MVLHIKNMVCDRCKTAVRSELEELGIRPISIELGEIEIQEEDIDAVRADLANNLCSLGFELLEDKKSQLIEHIKSTVIDLVHHSKEPIKINLSYHLSQKLHYNYHYLSNLFTEMQGATIEHYFIAQRIERVKELLSYDELSLTEITLQLNFSSASHLSRQFKKVTGMTPSHYKGLTEQQRNPLDEL